MTARALRATAPLLSRPQLVEPPPVTWQTWTPVRRFDVHLEHIKTPCGRVIERELAALPARVIPADATPELLAWLASQPRMSRENSYRLLEPVSRGFAYGVTLTHDGRLWGLAHTLRAPPGLPGGDAIAWELGQQRRAMDLIIANCRELQEGARRNCGIVNRFGAFLSIEGAI